MTDADVRLFRVLHDALSGGAAVLALMAVLTAIGSGWSMIALAPMLAWARTRRFAGALLGVLVGTSLVVFALKNVVGRARPCACLRGVHALVFAAPTDYSFPSGHAAGSFAFAAFVAVVLARAPSPWSARRRLALGASLFAVALGIALSRVALGVHFPGDVAVGAALGASLGALGGVVYVRRIARETGGRAAT